ncbi:MAG TPA: hypothetical protein EYP17_01135, partial [Candidatus Latescibacteria bacterium]|nr:hypothetical protein [Candidatus Latescibacterota bacterium]
SPSNRRCQRGEMFGICQRNHCLHGRLISRIAYWTLSCQEGVPDVNIVPCDIVRDERGLALSSRNVYLKGEEKDRALCLSKSLKKATHMVLAKELDVETIKKEMLHILGEADKVEYIAIVNREFKAIDTVEVGNTIILVATWVGKPRLIDNLWI